MKKVLAIVLSLIMAAALFTGCSKKADEPAGTTPTVAPTQAAPTAAPTVAPTAVPTAVPTVAPTTAPTAPAQPAIAPDTKFNAFEQFDQKSATGENVPWVYSFTSDGGKTWDPLTAFEASETLFPWHPWAGSWIGVGLNNDVPNLIELNTDMKDGMNGGLGFKAPADGKYVLTGYVINPWDQTADVLHCQLNGADLFTVQPGKSSDPAAVFPETSIDLKAGDIVYFFCPSLTADGWVSAYVDVNFYYAPTVAVPALVLPTPKPAQ